MSYLNLCYRAVVYAFIFCFACTAYGAKDDDATGNDFRELKIHQLPQQQQRQQLANFLPETIINELIELVAFDYIRPQSALLLIRIKFLLMCGYRNIPFGKTTVGDQAGTFIVTPDHKRIYLMFRGTKHLRETQIGINMVWKDSKLFPGKYHKGFYNRFVKVLPEVMGIMTKLMKHINMRYGYNDTKIIISGHSMGAALALMMGQYLSTVQQNHDFKVIVFACPKCMNTQAANHYNNNLGSKTLRVVQDFYDPVPNFGPLIFGGKHVGNELRIRKIPGNLTHTFISYANAIRKWSLVGAIVKKNENN